MAILMFIATAFQWFAGTKVGRIVGLVALVAVVGATAYYKVKAIGRAEEREKNKEETDKFIKDKEHIDEDIANDSDADLNKRVRPWVSKGG